MNFGRRDQRSERRHDGFGGRLIFEQLRWARFLDAELWQHGRDKIDFEVRGRKVED